MELILYVVYLLQVFLTHALLFPPSSVIQLIGSINVPVTNLSPQRRVAFDWGFQMNYDMPFDVASFYNVPIWSTLKNSTTRMVRNSIGNTRVHPRDFSLIEIFEATERILESFGYPASCLLLTICDLMHFPFDEQGRHIISEMLSFLLKPSQHGEHGSKHSQMYLLAELRGKMRLNCRKTYTNCTENPLDSFSKIIYNDAWN